MDARGIGLAVALLAVSVVSAAAGGAAAAAGADAAGADVVGPESTVPVDAPRSESARAYRDLSASDTGFTGPGRDLPPPSGLRTVRIGLLAPAERSAGRALRAGAALAIDEANARGGHDGIPYELVFRAADGPWGVGASQVTALAYEDSTWVILGGLEGGDAHLAELVAAKLWIPVVTPTAGDLSIDYANVPWVFRCFPSDAAQAELLLGWAADRGHGRVLVLAEDDREGRTGALRLEQAAPAFPVELAGPRMFVEHRADEAVAAAPLAEGDAVAVWARPAATATLLAALRRAGHAGPVLVPGAFLTEDVLDGSFDPGLVVAAAGSDPGRNDGPWREFAVRYRAASGREPDAAALYAYDAARLVLAALETAGLNRVRIRDALAATDFAGIAGTYRFDGLGGASLEPVLLVLREGEWGREEGTGRSRAVGGTD